MREVAAASPTLEGEPARRAEAALKQRRDPVPFDVDAARTEFTAMMAAA
jgi:beta-N-acetylhexosaminidase